jgi:tRNA-binding EMAP/Myf-like protein
VDLGGNAGPVQIVFGGERMLLKGELVPAAPPGSWAIMRRPGIGIRRKKMRVRNYRGQRSHGMLCSLDELGWTRRGPDEVAVLRGVTPGQRLDDLPSHWRPEVVVGWERAKLMATVRTPLMDTFDPVAEAVGC